MLLNGTVAVAEFGSRFEADLAAQRLVGLGIEAAVVSDPAHATYALISQPGHQVVVSELDERRAAAVFAGDESEAGIDESSVGIQDRPRWFRWLTYALALSVALPLGGGVVMVLRDLFAAFGA